MLGAYTTVVVQQIFRDVIPAEFFGLYLIVSIPAAFLVAGAIGVAMERGIIRFLYGRPLETLLATLGLSLVLQQAVRTIFGLTNRRGGQPPLDERRVRTGQITITYNRLWIILFTLAVFAILLAMLRYTALGLEMRAVTQNRRMAASMGIATSRVDALTFGLGSGIAGIAGVALTQIDNVSPNLGQSYIIDSFMVVVFGGVGNLWGTLVGAFTLGIANKFLEPYGRRRARQDRHSGADHPVHPEAAARPVRAQGPGGGSMIPKLLTPCSIAALASSSCWSPASCSCRCSTCCCRRARRSMCRPIMVALFGKYACYAILALSIDLIWGYCGILSLGHGAFFALGGYAMGMYLMRQIGSRGVYGNPVLPDFMVFLNWRNCHGTGTASTCSGSPLLMVLVVPGLLAFVLRLAGVPLARHRRLSLDHHPGDDLRAAAGLLPQRYGLRRQQRPDRFQGHSRLQRAGRRHPRRAVPAELPGADARLPDLPVRW